MKISYMNVAINDALAWAIRDTEHRDDRDACFFWIQGNRKSARKVRRILRRMRRWQDRNLCGINAGTYAPWHVASVDPKPITETTLQAALDRLKKLDWA